MPSVSEQVRELEKRVEQLQHQLDAQIVLNRMILSDEHHYRERREEFRQIQAANDAAVAAATMIEQRAIIELPPALIRRMNRNWN